MKTNIVFVGFDIPFLEEFARQIADSLKYNYIDLSNNLDNAILSSINIPLEVNKPYLEARESLLYYSFAITECGITVISPDMYLANENYNMFNDCFVIYVDNQKINELDKMLEKIIKKHVNLVIQQENLRIDEIVDKVKG